MQSAMISMRVITLTYRIFGIFNWRIIIINTFDSFHVELRIHNHLRRLDTLRSPAHPLNDRLRLPLVSCPLHLLIGKVHLTHARPNLALQRQRICRHSKIVGKPKFGVGAGKESWEDWAIIRVGFLFRFNDDLVGCSSRFLFGLHHNQLIFSKDLIFKQAWGSKPWWLA